MSPRSKNEYTETIYLRYRNASHNQKTLILDEFCATLGYHRKHAIRVLKNLDDSANPKAKIRPYSFLLSTLHPQTPKKIWLAANLPCSKRLKAILPLWIPGYTQSIGPLPPEVVQALSRISPATIDRILSPTRIHYKKRGRSTTKPGTLLRNQIPIKTNQWDESQNFPRNL